MTVFKNKSNYDETPMFFGESLGVARYDVQKYSIFEKLTERQNGYFWRPTEVDLTRDSKDFKQLTTSEQHIFTSNLKRQILLDSIQGRAPSLAFLPITSIPELETWIQTWTYFETIHSRSYTHIIRNIYSNPSKVFDDMMSIDAIVDCGSAISEYYDKLVHCNNMRPAMWSSEGGRSRQLYEHKVALWLCLNAVNALEGIRFYVSFACSWAFAEMKKMEGNAKIIKFIARDENIHLASTQQMLKLLPKEDSDFAQIEAEYGQKVEEIFNLVIIQEKIWARYLFKDGSMIGLNEKLLCDYVEWIASKRMKAIDVNTYDLAKGITSNPLPWTQKWISGSEVQVAPQETELTSYTVGGVNNDVTDASFKGFSL